MLNRSKSSLRFGFLYVIINNIRRNFERKGGEFRAGRYPQRGLLPGRLCGVDPFFGVSVELGGLERHGSGSRRHYHGGVYHVPTERKKEEVAGISGFCRGCFFVYKPQYSGRILRLVFAFQLPQGLAELEAEQEYEVFVDDVNIGRMTTNLGGKLVLSVELGSTQKHVKIVKM